MECLGADYFQNIVGCIYVAHRLSEEIYSFKFITTSKFRFIILKLKHSLKKKNRIR